MQKEYLEKCVSLNMSQRDIAKDSKMSQTTVKYWMKKYGLQSTKKQFGFEFDPDKKFCPNCKLVLDRIMFYKRTNGNSTTNCKICLNIVTVNRQRKLKQQCLDYKGNKCNRCGYNKCVNAMEFHHMNPDEKDFNISRIKLLKFTDIVKQELDKCELLCSNCHREVHYYSNNTMES